MVKAPATTVSAFIDTHFRHFNAARLREAADAYRALIESGGRMFVSLAGAMSTGELGKTLGPMIRAEKVHGISCTGANLEEDLFNLVGHNYYVSVPEYRQLSLKAEEMLYKKGLNRVTDTAIPDTPVMKPVEDAVLPRWKRLAETNERAFPHEVLYDVINSGELKKHYQVDPQNSWLVAAAEKGIPIVVPGWEDSTLGNVFAAQVLNGDLPASIIKSGIEYMVALAEWYQDTKDTPIGFFQIGGGIAGDFSICVVPLLEQDADSDQEIPKWAYFCQVTDAVCSYGGYSGATPDEKITWGKLEESTPMFTIESDASIVCPLIFARVLGW